MLRRELLIFLIVGFTTVLIDFLTYRGLIWLQIVDVDIAKGVGFLTGTVFAYFANRLWTFGHKSHRAGSALRFSLLYLVTLGANVGVNAGLLFLLNNRCSFAVDIAFLVATGTSAFLNFVGMKFFVFSSQHPKEEGHV